MKHHALKLCLLVCAAGCTPHFPVPFTAAQFATYNTGAALAHYLSQPDASPSVCNPKNQGPHLVALGKQSAKDLTDGLFRGQVPPKLWGRCADALLHDLPPEQAALLLDSMGGTYRKLMRMKELEDDKMLEHRLRALHKAFIERPTGLDGTPEITDKLFADLNKAVDKHRLGPLGIVYGEELLDVIQIEQGKYQGNAITTETIATLYDKKEDKVLFRLATRLVDPTLREESKKKVIELRISESKFPEVRKNAQAVEAVMLRLGRLPMSATKYPPIKATLDAAKVPARGVLVQQSIPEQTAVLLGYDAEQTGVSVLPELQLRGALHIELRGVSLPVTVCGPSRELDVSPCVAAEEIKIANPIAYLDTDGAFHFKEHILEKDALDMAHDGANFQLPLSFANKPLVKLTWGLHYSRPTDLDLAGPAPGERGPDLKVIVDGHDGKRILYTMRTPGSELSAVAELEDAPSFHVISRGAQGFTGRAGYAGRDGTAGSDGASASCPSSPAGNGGAGGPGSNGGPAGDGGPGGNGGNVDVTLFCGQHCEQIRDIISKSVHSEAGLAGLAGPGGRAGRGGRGGHGGSSASCGSGDSAYVIAAGANGPAGADGAPGPDGEPGTPGRPGRTTLHIAK